MYNAFKFTKQLENAGFSRDQAETQLQVITEIIEGNLTTKQDLRTTEEKLDNRIFQMGERLEHKMLQLEYRLIIKIGTIITIALGAFATLMKLL